MIDYKAVFTRDTIEFMEQYPVVCPDNAHWFGDTTEAYLDAMNECGVARNEHRSVNYHNVVAGRFIVTSYKPSKTKRRYYVVEYHAEYGDNNQLLCPMFSKQYQSLAAANGCAKLLAEVFWESNNKRQ